MQPDIILLHPPSVYDFRRCSIAYGPISDLIPATPVFEMYPLGFLTLMDYLQRAGYSVRILNLAVKMLYSERYDVEKEIQKLEPAIFGIDLHWLVHAHGALEIAKIIKKYHPDTPVVLGGLSATYYHLDIMKHHSIDYILRGDSTELPMLKLIDAVTSGKTPADVPNLTWRSGASINVNPLKFVPENLNYLKLDYSNIIRSVFRFRDICGHLPAKDWFANPLTAVLTVRGCIHNCLNCGGSRYGYFSYCNRRKPAFRTVKMLVEDIRTITDYLKSPIFIVGDLQQPGKNYAPELFRAIKKEKIDNPIVLELFTPAPREFWRRVAQSIARYNAQISPESHSDRVREAHGRLYTTSALEATIEAAMEFNCERLDVFFMIGLPLQTRESVLSTVIYCEKLMKKYSRLHPFISPFAPFIDPGSIGFTHDRKFGYVVFDKEFEAHRTRLTAPSWKFAMSYETAWLAKDEIVATTYSAAAVLNRFRYTLERIDDKSYERTASKIRAAIGVMSEIDRIMLIKDPVTRKRKLSVLRERVRSTEELLCDKNELKWSVGRKWWSWLKILRLLMARKR